MIQPSLRIILAEKGINSFESLYGELKQINPIILHLDLETQETLGLDSEDRTFEEKVQLRSKVITTDYAAKNSEEVSLIDCVIDASLCISDNSNRLKKISFDSLIVHENVVINLHGNTSISIYELNCKSLTIRRGEGCKVRISNSNIFQILFENVDFSSLECTTNKIGKIELCSARFNEVNFDHNQIDFSLIDAQKDSKIYNEKLKMHNLFWFVSSGNQFDPICERSDHTSKRETLNFLASNPDIYADRKSLSRIRAIQSDLYSSNSKTSYCFMWAVGHFTNPSVFLLYMLLGFIIFADIFYISRLPFSIGGEFRPLSIHEALYFSGITMTTIGYGDISPSGWVRLMAVLESLWGVSMMSAFIVALYRKYVER